MYICIYDCIHVYHVIICLMCVHTYIYVCICSIYRYICTRTYHIHVDSYRFYILFRLITEGILTDYIILLLRVYNILLLLLAAVSLKVFLLHLVSSMQWYVFAQH